MRGHKHFNLTMRKAILLLSIGSTIFALILLTLLFGFYSRRVIRRQAMEENNQTLSRMETEINDRLHDIFVEMISIYSETDLMMNLRHHSPDHKSLRPYYWSAWRIARSSYSSADQLEAMYIYDKDSDLVSSYRRTVLYYPQNLFEPEIDVNSAPIKKYLESDNTNLFVTGYHNTASGGDLLRCVLKLHSYDEQKTTFGYIVCDFDSRVLTEIVKKYIPQEDVYLWMQPVGDRPFVHVGDEKLSPAAERIYHIVSRQLRNASAEGFPGNVPALAENYPDYYLTSDTASPYGLFTFMLTPQSLVYATQNMLVCILLVISLFMVVLIGLVSALISRSLSIPVEEMKKTIIKIKGGDTALRVRPVGWSEELQLLGTEFNEMLDKIQDMIQEEYESKILMERTEYKALQAQINPHFLYNTLDTMSGIANAQDCVLVSGLCQSLSAIFRYSLDISDSLSTMQKEMAHVRNYLYVMDVRNGNSVKYDFQIDSDTLEDAIPRITIQPIVENALQHGLRSSRRKDKLLTICAGHRDGDLVIEITDNGVGMDAGPMNQQLEEADIHRVEIGRSIGVLNVNARLKQVFGSAYGIHIDSAIGEGTKVTIRVPVSKEAVSK